MEEASVLIARSQSGDKGAREVLIEKNLGLVHSIVRRFAGRGADMEDLFQIGAVGLIKAIDKFDLSLGLKFSTYAVPMITGEIRRFLRDDGMVKVSRTLKEQNCRLRAARQKLQGELGREPTLQEIAEEASLSREEAVMALEAGAEVESLYAPASQEDGSEVLLVDRVTAGERGAVGGALSGGEDREKDALLDRILLKELLGKLSDQERELLYMRYFQEKTQAQIAGILGVSQVQVSRLEKRILLRLRALAGV